MPRAYEGPDGRVVSEGGRLFVVKCKLRPQPHLPEGPPHIVLTSPPDFEKAKEHVKEAPRYKRLGRWQRAALEGVLRGLERLSQAATPEGLPLTDEIIEALNEVAGGLKVVISSRRVPKRVKELLGPVYDEFKPFA